MIEHFLKLILLCLLVLKWKKYLYLLANVQIQRQRSISCETLSVHKNFSVLFTNLTFRMKKFRCNKMNNYFLLVTFHFVSTRKMYSTGLFATGPTFLVTSSFGWVCNFLWAKVLGPLVTVVKFQKYPKPKQLLLSTYSLWWSKSCKRKLMNFKGMH